MTDNVFTKAFRYRLYPTTDQTINDSKEKQASEAQTTVRYPDPTSL